MTAARPFEFPVRLLDGRNRPYTGDYLVRLQGWTLKDYLRLAPENAFVEFVRGEVLMASPVSAAHQEVVIFLAALLRAWLRKHQPQMRVLTGPAAVQVLPDVVREPDVFVVPGEAEAVLEAIPLPVRPDFIIEVTSPSTRTVDLVEKPLDYAQAGVPEYWVVDMQERTVVQHRLTEPDRYATQRYPQGWVSSSTLPGFRVRVDWLFPWPRLSVDEALKAMSDFSQGNF